MANLEEKVMQSMAGEKRFNPDQQRHFLGTFGERVVLGLSLEDCQNKEIKEKLNQALEKLTKEYSNLQVKISGSLTASQQMQLMKLAQASKLKATIVNEDLAQSPYGLIVHSDQAVQVASIDFREIFADLLEPSKTQTPKKKGLFAKLFKK